MNTSINLPEPGLDDYLSFACSPVPWQLIYKRTFGRMCEYKGDATWSLLSGEVSNPDPLSFDPKELLEIPVLPKTTCADPFFCSHADKEIVFFEEWSAGSNHAHISAAQLSDQGLDIHTIRPVIETATHLSYPFVFNYDDRFWMIPEASASGSLQLYRCEKFPYSWSPEKSLLKGIPYADPTMFEHNGRWWLFITFRHGIHGLNSDLFLYSASDPISGDWSPHPLNPVVRGFHNSRPAGRPFVHDGRLYRPSQNCLKRYGYGLKINLVTELSTETFRETTVREILPWDDRIIGIHHLDFHQNRILMDIHLKC